VLSIFYFFGVGFATAIPVRLASAPGLGAPGLRPQGLGACVALRGASPWPTEVTTNPGSQLELCTFGKEQHSGVI